MVGVAARRSIEQIEKTSAIRPSRFHFLISCRKISNKMYEPKWNIGAYWQTQPLRCAPDNPSCAGSFICRHTVQPLPRCGRPASLGWFFKVIAKSLRGVLIPANGRKGLRHQQLCWFVFGPRNGTRISIIRRPGHLSQAIPAWHRPIASPERGADSRP